MRFVFIFIVLLLFIFPVRAQVFPNAGLEQWTLKPFNVPTDYWITSDYQFVPAYGVDNALKVQGSAGMYAMRLETVVKGADTLPAYVANTIGDIGVGEGGRPYAVMATGIKGSFRYNLAPGDSACLIVMFKKNTMVVATDVFKVGGSQATFAAFNFPLSLSVVPDTVVIAMTSGNPGDFSAPDWKGLTPGSWIEWDELAFTGTGVTPIPDGGFERWTAKQHEYPTDWTDGDPEAWFRNMTDAVKRSTDAYQGSYAAQLNTLYDTINNYYVEIGTLTTAQVPINTIPDVLTGYYKYSTPGNDTAMLQIRYYDADGIALNFTHTHFLPPIASYTKFELEIDPSSHPAGAESMVVLISSSAEFGIWGPIDPTPGSVLLVDEMGFKNATHIVEPKHLPVVSVYPNPTSDLLHISCKHSPDNTLVLITDAFGKTVYAGKIINGKAAIPVRQFPAGNYFYRLMPGDMMLSGTFVKQ